VTMKLTLLPSTHPDEDVIENYAFGRLCDQQAAALEEHLLICEKCQGTLARTDEYIRLMKAGTAAFVTERDVEHGAEHVGASPGRVRVGRDGLRRNIAAAAVLLLTCLTALLSWRTPAGEPISVALHADRGEISEAAAGQPLDLKIDLSDLPPAAGYRVEIVDATGRRVWFGGTPARLTKGLSPGVYWLRLFTDTGELLREYGLRAS